MWDRLFFVEIPFKFTCVCVSLIRTFVFNWVTASLLVYVILNRS